LQGGRYEAARQLLRSYREGLLESLPEIAQEGYGRAYPQLLRLHMLTVRRGRAKGRRRRAACTTLRSDGWRVCQPAA
jgi:hypothetical protein